MSTFYTCLFTKHKTRKSKIWQDGYIQHVPDRKKIVLLDEEKKRIDSKFHAVISSGDHIVFDRYLVDVDEQCEEPRVSKPLESSENVDAGEDGEDEERKNDIVVDRTRDAQKEPTLSCRPIKRRLGLRRAVPKPYVSKGHASVKEVLRLDQPSDASLPESVEHADPNQSSSLPHSSSSVPSSFAPEDIFFRPMPKLPPTPEKCETLSELDLLGAWESAPSVPQSSDTTDSRITNPKVLELFSDQASSSDISIEEPKKKFRKLSSSSRSTVEHHGWAHPELSDIDIRRIQFDEKIHFDSKCLLPVANRFASSSEYSATYKNAISEGILSRIQMLCQTIQNSSSPDGRRVDWAKVRRCGFAAFETCSISKREYFDKSIRKRVARFRLEIGDRWVGESVSYSKDDLWILSSTPFVWDGKGTLVCALSRFYGIAKDHTLEIVPISRPDSLHMLCAKGSSNMFAFRIDSIGTDIQMLQVLEEYGMNDNACKFSSELLGTEPMTHGSSPPNAICHTSPHYLHQSQLSSKGALDISLEFEENYHLNDEQKDVLRYVASWYSEQASERKPPVLLVQGVFGSGKSHLLIALLAFMCKLREAKKAETSGRILLCSVTNVAVDNILLRLLESGFTSFSRVGSRKKIARKILRFTLGAEKETQSDVAIKELKEILQEHDVSMEERKSIEESIQDLQTGKLKELRDRVKTLPIVAATFAATCFPVLDDCSFDIVVMDEATQSLEPMCLVPFIRFKPSHAILVGDPCQLSPTLSIPSDVPCHPWLLRSMFDRLITLNIPLIFVGTQYRCHPHISRLPNMLFYDGKMKDGISIEDRAPLVHEVPALLLIDSQGSREERMGYGSYVNEAEASVVVHLATLFAQCGVPEHEIGVIALYKGQAGQIHSRLRDTKIQVSTVDAFQGGEKEVILLSFVRSSSLGFCDEPNRMNVALTRAKRHLVIIGSKSVLAQSGKWRSVLQAIRNEECSESMIDFHAALSIAKLSPTDCLVEENCEVENTSEEELG